MIYIVRAPDGAIRTYGEGDGSAVALADGDSLEVRDTALAAYAARLTLTADRRTIRPDGVDEARVTVRTDPPLSSVALLVGGLAEVIALSGGEAVLTLTADAPGVVVIEPDDPAQFCRGGQGSISIEADEEAA